MDYETGTRLDRLEQTQDAIIKVLLEKGIIPKEQEVEQKEEKSFPKR